MAYFDERQKQIILSEDDKEMFKECMVNSQNKKTPIANRIMKAIIPIDLQGSFNLNKQYD
jgi:hypothetical protein